MPSTLTVSSDPNCPRSRRAARKGAQNPPLAAFWPAKNVDGCSVVVGGATSAGAALTTGAGTDCGSSASCAHAAAGDKELRTRQQTITERIGRPRTNTG